MPKDNSSAQILRSNIAALDGRLSAASEQRDICVQLLAADVCQRHTSGRADVAYAEFVSFIDSPTCVDKAQMCRAICDRREFVPEIEKKHLFGSGDEPLAGTHGKIAYVRNRRFDDAYMAFSERVRGAKAYYAASFIDACEAVYDNKCEFCMLPVENGTDGKLYSFYSMIDRYELKICDVLTLSEDNDTQTVTYALIGRNVSLSDRRTTGKRFEFSVSLESAEALGDVIHAGISLGGSIFFVGSQPVPYDDRYRYFLAMDFTSASPTPMALYMELEYPGYTPLGLYAI